MVLDNNLVNFYYMQMNIDSVRKLEDLIKTIKPDTVKVDIEGAEKYLLSVNPEILKIPKEWYIEGHTINLFNYLSTMFSMIGYQIINRFPIPKCPENTRREQNDEMYIAVFICRRK